VCESYFAKKKFMISRMVDSPTFLAFLFASLILAVIPGPGVVYIVTRTLGQGRHAGLASIGGIALGNLGNAIAASVGLAALLATSATAFLIIKYAGAAYLIFLGIQALFVESPVKTSESTARVSSKRLFWDGFLVALLNPKTALFFAALLPQFISPGYSPLRQSVVLGCVFVLIAICTDTAYVLTAAVIAPTINSKSRLQPLGRYVTAATFIGLGVYAALVSPRSDK
jgi:threonine/homoserine/homoserine lactone efflux protein